MRLPAWARPPDSEVVRVCVIEHAASLALASVVARVSGSSSRKRGRVKVASPTYQVSKQKLVSAPACAGVCHVMSVCVTNYLTLAFCHKYVLSTAVFYLEFLTCTFNASR